VNCLYLHIPFCRSKCLYCSFSSFSGLDSLHQRYCEALKQEIRAIEPAACAPLDSVFIGGGTPTVLEPPQLDSILACCRETLGLAPDAEISLEANPGTLDYDDLHSLWQSGFNRISFGVQSFDDPELQGLGRLHTGEEARRVVEDARRAGFDNLSLDLMYGLPKQSCESWQDSLEQALALEPEHLSAYQLSVDEGTVFYDRVATGTLNLPGEAYIEQMDRLTVQFCRAAGLTQYEISNFARPGYGCRHNLNYWRNEAYQACGAGAVSYVEGVRAKRLSKPLQYCRQVEQGGVLFEESEELEPHASFRESVVMGLRLLDGISEARLEKRYGLQFGEVYPRELTELAKQGLLLRETGRIALSEKGRQLANQVMALLV
jgi:oxygen-independent coproporphyrinogen-3 oxidase